MHYDSLDRLQYCYTKSRFSSALPFIPVEDARQPVGQVCLKMSATGEEDIPTSPFVRCGNISCRLTATAIRSTKSVPPTRSGYV